MHKIFILLCSLLLLASSCCNKLPVDPSFVLRSVNVPADSVTFAVIGDYGTDDPVEGEVANMVSSWNPDFIITTGDNNYPLGAAGTIQKNIGKYYCDYIYNPDAPVNQQCHGKAEAEKQNRFFPSPGNHDNYSAPPMQPYLDYFSLPGDERNYEFTWGPVHFYSMNTGKSGNIKCCESAEAKWLNAAATKSITPFNFVYFHHPPYSVSNHGSSTDLQWPYSDWKIDAVFSGHEHVYEKVIDKMNSTPIYLVCGNSGREHLYDCDSNPLDTSRFDVRCDNTHFGAIRVKVNSTQAIFEYFTTSDLVHPADIYILHK